MILLRLLVAASQQQAAITHSLLWRVYIFTTGAPHVVSPVEKHNGDGVAPGEGHDAEGYAI